jgi:hypothetical protein
VRRLGGMPTREHAAGHEPPGGEKRDPSHGDAGSLLMTTPCI